jgi:hypothetical protein
MLEGKKVIAFGDGQEIKAGGAGPGCLFRLNGRPGA